MLKVGDREVTLVVANQHPVLKIEDKGAVVYDVCSFNFSSVSANAVITMTLTSTQFGYVDWGDGTNVQFFDSPDTALSHTYSLAISPLTILCYVSKGPAPICNGSNLSTVYLSQNVTSIGRSAFSGCSSLTSITIPNSVEEIERFAFEDCTSLTSITIPNSVTSIGVRAFQGCSSLTSIEVVSGNTKYHSNGDCLIETKEKLLILGCKESTIPNDGTVTSIGGSAFDGCSGLTSIVIPNSVTSIGNRAFAACSNLTSIIIPDGVISIEPNVFNGCSSLTSITIPDSVTSIGNLAFQGCSSLTSINIPDNVTSIGNGAFSGCSSLTSMTIPFVGRIRKTSTDTYQYPFGYIFGMGSYTGGTATTQTYYGSSTSSTTSDTYYIPSGLKSVTVTGGNILYGAFSGCSSLTSITIQDSVTSIESGAFSGCTSLTSITIPFVGGSIKTSTDTWQYPFGYIFGASSYTGGTATTQYYYGWSTSSTTSSTYYIPLSLKKVTVTGGNILYGAFYNCKSLTSITIPNSVTSIARYAFISCGLTSITIPDSVTSIGYNAFHGSGLTSVTIPNSVTSIESSAFEYCSSLTSVTIPNSVTSIEYGTFAYCKSLTSITIPDSVTSIGEAAFYDCISLTSIVIPNSVTSIGRSAFEGCSSLQYNEYDNGYYLGNTNNTYLVLVKAKSKDITSCTIPYNTKIICYEAFEKCSSLTSIIIPNSVISIGWSAFAGSYYTAMSINSITIGNSVTEIREYAFAYCSSLTSINYTDTKAQWDKIVKYSDWRYFSAIKTLICTDGTFSI